LAGCGLFLFKGQVFMDVAQEKNLHVFECFQACNSGRHDYAGQCMEQFN